MTPFGGTRTLRPENELTARRVPRLPSTAWRSSRCGGRSTSGCNTSRCPHGTIVGDARFLQLIEDDVLAQSFAWFRDAAPELVCEVEAIGGTDALLLQRARKTAERALALARQQILFGFMAKIYLDQVMFGLDGKYTWRAGADLARAGWWRDPAPFPMDLTGPRTSEWRAKLDRLSADYLAVSPGIRERVDVCLE